MGDKITNYQCPNCTAPLHFDGTIGKLKCDFCESTFTAEEIRASARTLPKEGFLPAVISINGKNIGPADWLYAALDVLTDARNATIVPDRPQLPSLDCLPKTRDLSLKGTWRHSDTFEDRYLSDRLRWQSWTMRF